MALKLEVVPRKAAVVRRGKAIVAACFFGPDVRRPFVYPFVGPAGCELTRLGHPADPVSHSHHRSIWVGHHDVGGVDFWADDERSGRIDVVEVDVERATGASVAVRLECRWRAPDAPTLVREDRRLEFFDLPGEELALDLEVRLQAARRDEPVTLGKTPFGLLGIRVARTMRVAERLGGRIVNSAEGEDEAGVFWQHADWCDYSGPVPLAGDGTKTPPGCLPSKVVGIACFDDPANHPADTFWHVRDDGWMGPCIGKDRDRSIPSREPLIARYRIVGHTGRAGEAGIAERYRSWRRARGGGR